MLISDLSVGSVVRCNSKNPKFFSWNESHLYGRLGRIIDNKYRLGAKAVIVRIWNRDHVADFVMSPADLDPVPDGEAALFLLANPEV